MCSPHSGPRDSVGGVSSTFVTQLFEFTDFDGNGLNNADPSDSLEDPDGDGLASFLDPDNDDDALSDAEELAQGSDINLVTPEIDSVSPDPVGQADTTLVTVTGMNFDPGMGVTLDAQLLTPSGVTATSLDPQPGVASPE